MIGNTSGAVDRRRLLGLLAAGTTAGVAGCLGGDGGGEDRDDSAGDDEDDDHVYDRNAFSHPGEEPVEFTESQRCPVCTMTPLQYPDWRCQLAHENGDGVAFDTPGCLFAYYAFLPIDSPVVAGWVTEYEQRELVDATEAYYVVVTDDTAEEADDDVMKLNPRPFADREDAVAYLAEWEAEPLTEDDVIRLEDVDREHAEIYRGNRLPN
ncbi:NosL protein [Halobiforma haloterrestris]|uniref:NosL protein n=1 Tax=Natronobacterium haloterrestre TaxID=148448 RepID=A0A1I1G392_NATHA|nr:nitrous oxide reductase accessory protein NosL [Halobiforma haloterrestris]SFC06005.1 NosL protein [Halobiforma haloterrestris]